MRSTGMQYGYLTIAIMLASLLSCKQVSERNEHEKTLIQLVHRNFPAMEEKVHLKMESENTYTADEKFKLETKGGELYITANSDIAASTGLNWYIKYYCRSTISHTGDNLSLPASLPDIITPIEKNSPYTYRYALNYCTINYSMSFWDWKRWERELDWMALNGVNMILAPIGNELVWYNVLRKMGFDDNQSKSYAPGPAFTAWWLMGNLEGWQGPLSNNYIEQQAELQKKILSRCKELGIIPIVQGFYGMVPTFLKNQYPKAHIISQGTWEGGFTRSDFLDPSDSLFSKVSGLYYQELLNLYGNDLRFFGGDPFHEGGNTGGLNLTTSGHMIHNAVSSFYPGAVWVLQAWQGNPKPELLKGFGEGHALVLDLFGESDNSWEKRVGYRGHPWIWCMINNFGEKTGMIGKLQVAITEPQRAKQSLLGDEMQGIGIIPEGINNNAVLYDLLLEMAWRSEPVDPASWIKTYVLYRYGTSDEHLIRAWQLLLQSVYSSPKEYNILGPTESVMLAKPSFNVTRVSSWGTTNSFYENELVSEAAAEMLAVSSKYWHLPTFRYDCIDVFRQMLSDRSQMLYNQATTGYRTERKNEYVKSKTAFLTLILQQDSLCSMDKSFTLGRWLNEARSRGNTEQEKDQFEQNAKVQISFWGPINQNSSLIDYAGKQWSGMLRTYYYDRWLLFFTALDRRVEKNDYTTTDPDIKYFILEKEWAEKKERFDTTSLVTDREAFLRRLLNQTL